MKIALIIGDSTLTGAPTHVMQVGFALEKEGHDVYILCPSGPLAKRCKDLKFKTDEIQMGGPFDKRAMNQIRDKLSKIDPEIAHFHGVRAGWLGFVAARNFKNIKKIYTEHLWTKYYHLSNPAYEQFQLRSLKFLSRYMNRIIAVSKSVKDFLISKGFDENKILIIPNGISEEFFKLKPINKPKGTPLVIGSVGSLNRVKNYEVTLTALSIIKKQKPSLNVHYQIIGEGPLKKKLESLSEKLKLTGNVHFLGRVDNVAERLQHFSVFLNSSLSESFGLAVGEAMAVGLPVVASNIDPLRDLVSKGGIYINPRSPKDIAEKLISLLEDDDRRKKLGDEGRKRIKKFFSEKQMIDKTVALYRKVLQEK